MKANLEDQECAQLVSQIYWGMTEGLQDAGDPKLNAQFESDGALEILTLLLHSGIKDDKTVGIVAKSINNIVSAGIKIDEPVSLLVHPQSNEERVCAHLVKKTSIALQS